MIPTLARFMALAALAGLAAATAKSHVLIAYDAGLVPDVAVLQQKFSLDADKYDIAFVDYANKKEALFDNGAARYDHAVFLPSAKKAVDARQLVERHRLMDFFNAGGNVVAVGAAENSVPEEVRLFLNQAGVYPAPKGFALADHFDPTMAIGDANLVSRRIVSRLDRLQYSGSAALVSNNQYVFPLVKAPKLSFTSSPKDKVLSEEKTWTVGEQGFLAVAFQGLNNARGAWVGSLDLVSDELVSWVLQERGVLKLQFVEHYKQDEPGHANRTLYRIKDEVTYTAGVSELRNGAWVPYTPASDDALQLAFKMLDPYQRLNMQLLGPASSTGEGAADMNVFHVQFTVPDHHGMFTFELDYKREGLSYIEDKRIVTVRHLANDEYRRSWEITNAWMYMASAALAVVAWVAFVANFLYIGAAQPVKKTAEKKGKAEDKKEKKEKK